MASRSRRDSRVAAEVVGALPKSTGPLVDESFPIKAESRSVDRIWQEIQSDSLDRTGISHTPDRVADTPVVITSWKNGTIFLAMKLKDRWVARLGESERKELLGYYNEHLGFEGTLELDDDALILTKTEGTFERVAVLPSHKQVDAQPQRTLQFGPLVVQSGDFDGEQTVAQSVISLHLQERPVTSLADTELALKRFTTIVQGYLAVASQSLKLKLPREKIFVDGTLVESDSEPETPAGFMMAQSEMSRRDLAKLLEPGDVAPVSFADVRGQDAAVAQMKKLATQIRGRKTLDAWGARLPTGILMVGPPGNGKTMLASAAANEANAAFLVAKVSHIFRGLWGETEQRADWLVEIAREKAKAHPSGACILVLDEVDSIAENREGASFSGGKSALNLILTNLSGLRSDHSVVVIATTNLPDILDRAFLDRMDLRLNLPLPDEKGRSEILLGRKGHYSARATTTAFGEIDFARIAKATEGYSGRKLDALINRALIEKGVWEVEHGRKPNPVSTDDLLCVVRFHGDELEQDGGKIGF